MALQTHSEPLAGLRAIEFGTGIACAYAGKVLAAFGADVVRLSGADDPSVAGASGPIRTAHDDWLHCDKRIVAAPSDTAAPSALTLLRSARIVLVGVLAPDAKRTLEKALDACENPSLVQVRLSWFGEAGPYAAFAGSDSVCRALAGAVRSMGRAEGPPVLPEDGHLGILSGTLAVVPALAGLFARDAVEPFSISTHEVGLLLSELETGQAMTDGLRRPRLGINRFPRNFPSGPYQTKNGWIGVTVTTAPQWKALCKLLRIEHIGDDARYATSPDRIRQADALDAVMVPIFKSRTTETWFEEGRPLRLPLAPMPGVAELASHPVLKARQAFGTVARASGAFAAPVIPLHLNGTPPRHQSRAPEAVKPDVVGWLGDSDSFPSIGTGSAQRPLEGIRIVDLTMGWAGPLATKLLADLGAEVIKVESCVYPDWWRGKGTGPEAHEHNLWFHTMNRNKLGITLDLKQEDARQALRCLLENADAVIDNYASDVLPSLGLDQAKLAVEYPGLIVESITCFGADSEWRDVRAYGTTMEQASGLPSMTGDPDDPPTMCHSAYGDPVGGVNAAAALMVALVHKKRTGRGQRVDLSAVECLLPLGAFRIIEHSIVGTTAPRLGNRHPYRAPHGCFRCADGEWVVVDVATDVQWQSLCKALQRRDLAEDPLLRNVDGRLSAQERIEAAITAWTMQRDSAAAMRGLQACGVPSGVVCSPVDLKSDPHLLAREYWQQTTHRVVGAHLQPSSPVRVQDAPLPVRRPAPTLGQHSTEVLLNMAGLNQNDIARFAQAGVIGETPRKQT